jgi:hypothetical protein
MEGQKRRAHVDFLHNLPAEGNLWDENGNALKLAIVEDYNTHGQCRHRKNDK